MSWDKYDDDCPGCRPVLIDPTTGKVSPPDSPEMKAIMEVWQLTTLTERQAWHRFTCQNSRTPGDLRIINHLVEMMGNALEKKT